MLDAVLPDLSPPLRSLISLGITVLLALAAYVLVMRAFRLLAERGKLAPHVALLVRPVLRWTMITLVVLLLLDEVGVLRNAWAALTAVLAMVAIGFVAVWSVVSNALCTLLLLVFKPFRMGDRVELPSEEIGGTAVDINFMFTTLRDDEGRLIQVPNNTFFQKVIRKSEGEVGLVELHEQLERDAPSDQSRSVPLAGPGEKPRARASGTAERG